MNIKVFLLGLFTSITALIITIIHKEILTLILSTLTSVIAATIFYFFQIYWPQKSESKNAKMVYSKNIHKLLDNINNNLFFLKNIMTDNGIKIDTKIKFFKEISDKENCTYSFINYNKDIHKLSKSYDKLIETYSDYTFKYGEKKERDLYLSMKFDDFFSVICSIFNDSTDVSFYSLYIKMPEYEANLDRLCKNLENIAGVFDYHLENKGYKFLTEDEIKEYIDTMNNPKFQDTVIKAIPYIYANNITANIYCQNKWYKKFDVYNNSIIIIRFRKT